MHFNRNVQKLSAYLITTIADGERVSWRKQGLHPMIRQIHKMACTFLKKNPHFQVCVLMHDRILAHGTLYDGLLCHGILFHRVLYHGALNNGALFHGVQHDGYCIKG